ncbi:helix-turn-helix transcriptional regulator [Streptomyces roseirectus]|uniref:Helix-turn-helix transcriptional regulator n=1 Tax=Streptomyces roseirectus TaxID=2768066 RepID=A0A7H0IH39_9ACTN|nr:helix-turn-helix transcriptional regulator [Streptomyces roseirectus]QNP72105.1 helix-turn-helix transcriptional regulator [Streptomyces roseirectus]
MGEATSARRRRVGAQLRQWRLAEGLTLQEVADRLEVSLATASRWETGRTKVSLDTYSRLADLYRVGVDERVYFERLCRDADEPGWWMRYADLLSDGLRNFVELESQALREFCYNTALVPGLVQTSDYRRAVNAAFGLDPQKVERDADMTIARQAILTRSTPPFEGHVVIHEVALHQVFEGRPHIMRDQLRRLRELSDRPNMTVQIIPMHRSVHIGSLGAFITLGYDGGNSTVYYEMLSSQLMINDPEEVDVHLEAEKELITKVALSPDESARKLEELIG